MMVAGESAMGMKHDVLTEDELASYRVNFTVRDLVEPFVRENHATADRKKTNILDWRCGQSSLGRHIRSQWLEGGLGRQNYQ
jgi:hypothetical protein